MRIKVVGEMFRQIMVPLDGSAAAEGAIGYAERLARPSTLQVEQCGATIHLVRAVAPVFILDPWGIGTHARIAQDNEAELLRAAGYLDTLRRRPRATDIPVRTLRQTNQPSLTVRAALVTGSLVAGLLEYERQHGIDLVGLASHEQTGLGHLRLGTLLHPLLRRGPAPLFVVPPSISPAFLEHALIPLDGSAGAEQARTLLGHLAPALVREVTLLRVVGTQEEPFEAFRYLSSLRQRPELTHLRSRLRVEYGDPVERIADIGRDRLVVLTKPRHWRPSRWVSASIADRLIRHGAAPLLIARQGTQSVRDDGSGARPQLSPHFPRAS
jgi:nucleotide-binding universal stress UspA family protein